MPSGFLHKPMGAGGRRSPASWRRNAWRRALWLRRRSEYHIMLLSDRSILLDRFGECFNYSRGALGSYCRRVQGKRASSAGRQCDTFPLPVIPMGSQRPDHCDARRWKSILGFANRGILSLNFLYGSPVSHGLPLRVTLGQHDVHRRIISRCVDFLARLEKCAAGTWEHLLPDWVPSIDRPAGPRYCDLKADRVDVLETAAQCNPSQAVPDDVACAVNSADPISGL